MRLKQFLTEQKYNFFVEIDDPDDKKNPITGTFEKLDDIRQWIKRKGTKGQEVRIWNINKPGYGKNSKPDKTLTVT